MWALLLIGWAAGRVYLEWRRSRLPAFDFIIIRVTRLYTQLWHRCRWNRRPAPWPPLGPALIVANHTCSSDPTFILAGSSRLLSFLAAREHYNLHPLARKILDYMRCVPVKRDNRDPRALRQALRRLTEGCAVCLFPEGNLSGVARNRFCVAKPGIAMLALVCRLPVYPVFISGGPRTENLLASWVWPSRRAVRVTYGQPVDLSAYHDRPRNRQLLEETTRFIMQRVQALNPAHRCTQRGRLVRNN
jgi:1-acyl-sn-glycerol-3-phosphate acyltransferase